MKNKKQKYWHIEGYDSLTPIYDKKVKVGCVSSNQIQSILKALAAKTGLSFDEIVGAYAKKRTKIHNDLLIIKHDGPNPITYTCGENPFFIATVINEDL